MGDFKITPSARRQMDAQRIISGDQGLDAADRVKAKQLLRSAAVDLIKRDGTVRSGYVVFKTDRDGNFTLDTSSRKKGASAVEFAKSFRQIVKEGWGDKPGVLDAVDRYLGKAQKVERGVGTQSLVGMVRMLERLESGGTVQEELARARLSKGSLNAARFDRAFDLTQLRSHVISLVKDAQNWQDTDPVKSQQFRKMLEQTFEDKVHQRLNDTQSPPGPGEKTALQEIGRLLLDATAAIQTRELDPHSRLTAPQGGADAAEAPATEQLFHQLHQTSEVAQTLSAREAELDQTLSSLEQNPPPDGSPSASQRLTQHHLNTVMLMTRDVSIVAARQCQALMGVLNQISLYSLKDTALSQRYDQVTQAIGSLEALTHRVATLAHAQASPEVRTLQSTLSDLVRQQATLVEQMKNQANSSEYLLKEEANQSKPGLGLVDQKVQALKRDFLALDLRIEASLAPDAAQAPGLDAEGQALSEQRAQLKGEVNALFDAQREALKAKAQALSHRQLNENERNQVTAALAKSLNECEVSRQKMLGALDGLKTEVSAPDLGQAALARKGQWAELAAQLKGESALPNVEAIAPKIRALGIAQSPEALKGLLATWLAKPPRDSLGASRDASAFAAQFLRAVVTPSGREVGQLELQCAREALRGLENNRANLSGLLLPALAKEFAPSPVVCAYGKPSAWAQNTFTHHYQSYPKSTEQSPLIAPNALVRLSDSNTINMRGADLSGALLVIEARNQGDGNFSLKSANLENTEIAMILDDYRQDFRFNMMSFNPPSFHIENERRRFEDWQTGKSVMNAERFENFDSVDDYLDSLDETEFSAQQLEVKPYKGAVGLLESIDGQRFPDQKRSVARQALEAAISWHSFKVPVLQYSPLLDVVRGDPIVANDPQISELIKTANRKLRSLN